MKCKTILLLVLLHTVGAFGQIYNPDTISVTTTPWSENWLLNTNPTDGFSDLGCSAWFQARAAIAGNADWATAMDSPHYNVLHYGVSNDGVDRTAEMQVLIDLVEAAGGGTIVFPPGSYTFEGVLDQVYAYGGASNASIDFVGSNPFATRIQAATAGHYALTVTGGGGWNWVCSVRNLSIIGCGKTKNGVLFNAASAISMQFKNVCIWDCDIGFRNLGLLNYRFDGCSVNRNNYGFWLEPLPTMHGGDAVFEGQGNISYNDSAGVYLHGAAGGAVTEQLVFRDMVMEGGQGYAFFVEDWQGSWPLTIENCYFESNGAGVTVDVNGVTYEPNAIYLDNCRNVRITDSKLTQTIDAHDSELVLDRCYIYVPTFDVNETGTTSVRMIEPRIDAIGGGLSFYCEDIEPVADTTARHTSAPGPVTNSIRTDVVNGLSNGSMAVPFTGINIGANVSYSFEDVNAPLFGKALRVRLPVFTGNDDRLGIASYATTVDHWYVFSLDVRPDGNDVCLSVYSSGGTGGLVRSDDPGARFKADRWQRLWSVTKAQYTNGAGPIIYVIQRPGDAPETFDISALQLVDCGTYQAAMEYVRSRSYAWPVELPRVYYDDDPNDSAVVTISAADNGKLYSNAGALAACEFDLPAAVVGLRYTFVRMASFDIDLDPSGTEYFRPDAGPGDYLRLDADGDTVCIQCLESGVWDIVGGYGTYAFEL